MPAGEVAQFFSYPWQKEDRHLINELCPWQRFYFSFHKTMRGAKVFKGRVPLIAFFDGDIHHRLSVMNVAGN
jgi:hypothetical protein